MKQIATVENSTHSIYEKDISQLRDNYEDLKRMFDAFFASPLKYEAV